MDWVEGQTLDKYIREHIDDQYELSLLAYQFSRLAMWLMPQPFAHGDLKPDNILVKEDGTLVLVDYDGMYVPAMKGQRARELGSPDFRHPGRTEEVFDDHIDDFSLASILLSLKAIALQPDLLEEYGASDRLLFSEKDYRNLSESNALGALQPLMQDSELASLYSLYILALSQNNLSQVSFRLFNLSRPDRSQYEEENLSTEVTEEDLANAWTDKYGAKYSRDGKRLLKGAHVTEYTIKSGVEIICDKAFDLCLSLHTVEIPNSVRIIGIDAFCSCAFKNVLLPESVCIIKSGAFRNCIKMESITLSPKMKCVDVGVFSWCSTLKSISIPTSVTQIKHHAFANCTSLRYILIPNSVTEIEHGSFERCSSLLTAYIPNSVKEIGDFAFSECRSLLSVFIENGVEKIGSSTFSNCSRLRHVCLPNSLNSGFGIAGCRSLQTIEVPYGSRDRIEKLLPQICKNMIIEQPYNLTSSFSNQLLRNGYKYGILKNRWGNCLIGIFKIDAKQLSFDGNICKKSGLSNYCYVQRFEQMVKTDYPLEIPKGLHDFVYSLIHFCQKDIVDILSSQAIKQRDNVENNCFYTKYDKFIDVCKITKKSGNWMCYDYIHLSIDAYPEMNFNNSFANIEKKEVESAFVDNETFDPIRNRIEEVNNCVYHMINELLNRNN